MPTRSLPSDPLVALGSSVFFNICEYLPYLSLARLPSVSKSYRDFSASNRSGLWRSASYRIGVAPRRIAELKELESDGQEITSEGTSREEAVDWRKICMGHICPDLNWRGGTLENFFVERSRHTATQYAVDDEDQTCMILSERGGIRSIDIKTMEPLFYMPYVCPGMEIAFCHGFFIVRAYERDFRFRIFRTRHAIARSANPWAARDDICNEARTATYLPDPSWFPKSVLRPTSGPDTPDQKRPPPIGRGCLAYYRDVIMPEYGGPRCMRVERKGTSRERVVLAVVGEEKVYMYDLDDADGEPEEYERPYSEPGVRHLDFNDDFIFLTHDTRVEILSRSTGKISFTFTSHPPPAAFMGLWTHDFTALAKDRVEPGAAGGARLTRAIDLQRYPVGSSKYQRTMGELDRSWARQRWESSTRGPPGFFACHPAGADLVYAHRLGQVVITRNFAQILSLSDTAERERKGDEQTLLLDLAKRIKSIAVYGSRIAVDTKRGLVFFDTAALPPSPPDASAGLPPIRMYKVLRVDPHVDEITHDPQIYSTAMYTRYLAHNAGQMGYRIRGLDFGAGIGQESQSSAQSDYE